VHAQFGCWFQSYPALLGIPKLKEHVLQIKHCIYLCNSFPAAPASHLWPRNLSVFSVHSEGHFAAPGHMMASNLPKGLEPTKTSREKYGSHWLVLAGSWQKKTNITKISWRSSWLPFGSANGKPASQLSMETCSAALPLKVAWDYGMSRGELQNCPRKGGKTQQTTNQSHVPIIKPEQNQQLDPQKPRF